MYHKRIITYLQSIIMVPTIRISSLTATLIAMLLISSSPQISLFAHTFSPGESASFLSLVDQIKSALLPIKQDISSNVTLAREQAQYAKLLLNESRAEGTQRAKSTNYNRTAADVKFNSKYNSRE